MDLGFTQEFPAIIAGLFLIDRESPSCECAKGQAMPRRGLV